MRFKKVVKELNSGNAFRYLLFPVLAVVKSIAVWTEVICDRVTFRNR